MRRDEYKLMLATKALIKLKGCIWMFAYYKELNAKQKERLLDYSMKLYGIILEGL